MSDYGDALREINTLKSQIRWLEEGHSILNQALHKSQEREIKLRNLLTDARSRLKCQPQETTRKCDACGVPFVEGDLTFSNHLEGKPTETHRRCPVKTGSKEIK